VIGVPDEEFGQRLRAFVVPIDGHTPDPDEIKTYVRANLARYKVPRDVVFLDELPRNTTGKVLRRELAAMS
jgi:fatty-acyl-CoA synthase